MTSPGSPAWPTTPGPPSTRPAPVVRSYDLSRSTFILKWSDDRTETLDPSAVPAAVGQPVLGEPPGEGGHVSAQAGTVREGDSIDAALDLAATLRQIVLVAAGRGQQLPWAAHLDRQAGLRWRSRA